MNSYVMKEVLDFLPDDDTVKLFKELNMRDMDEILMCNKDREVLSKQTRAMDVRYFAIKDNIEKGFLKVMHVGTSNILGDFFTKPLQGSKFQEFRDLILGKFKLRSSAEAVGSQ